MISNNAMDDLGSHLNETVLSNLLDFPVHIKQSISEEYSMGTHSSPYHFCFYFWSIAVIYYIWFRCFWSTYPAIWSCLLNQHMRVFLICLEACDVALHVNGSFLSWLLQNQYPRGSSCLSCWDYANGLLEWFLLYQNRWLKGMHL